MQLKMVRCPNPGCGLPARVLDQWTFDSTDGPVEHVKTRCRAGHVLTPSVDMMKGFLILHPSLGMIQEPSRRPATASRARAHLAGVGHRSLSSA